VQRSDDRVNSCWPWPAQPILVSGPVGINGCIFVISKNLHVLKWDLLFNERRGLTTSGHYAVWLERSLTGPYLHTHTHALIHSRSDRPLGAETLFALSRLQLNLTKLPWERNKLLSGRPLLALNTKQKWNPSHGKPGFNKTVISRLRPQCTYS
jgi:hypothetical protein